MSGVLPEVYWYLFWIGVVLLLIGFGILLATLTHRRNVKALEILKLYAERAVDPPASIAEPLARQILDDQRARPSKFQSRSELLRAFIGFLFSACVVGGVHYWLVDASGPSWAVHASRAAMSFFGFGAFGLLLACLLARKE